ncbi:MAG: hypothetical protein CTY12_00675 [Methylotenera sp.]|nr:MAG: hypothetical protein CTY12_00675 [Methylotenera sp.]
MKRITKKEKAGIQVWTDINTSIVAQFGPKEEVKPDFQAMVMALATETSWEEVYNKLTAGNNTKMSRAVDIYTKLLAAGKARKDVITAFKTDLEMTDAGASTYFQNVKKAVAKK